MQFYGSLHMTTKNGLSLRLALRQRSYDAYYAFGGCHKPLHQAFQVRWHELRDYYRKHLSWGYSVYEQAWSS